MLTTPLASLIGHSYSSTAGAEGPADAVQTQFEELTLPLIYREFSTRLHKLIDSHYIESSN